MKKIPTTILTGFLGAGKTTILTHILNNANGKKFAVLINEFGTLGIDKELVMGCGIAGCNDTNVIELANGCICCTVADEFLPTMQFLLDQETPPDHIIIETSGLALPKPLITAFQWHEIKARITIDAVVCVIDAPALYSGNLVRDARPATADHDDTPVEEVFEDQLVMADIVILNKCDAIDLKAIKTLHDKLENGVIEGKRKGVPIINAVKGDVPINTILGVQKSSEDYAPFIATHHDNPDEDHDHDEFVSIAIEFGAVNGDEGFDQKLLHIIEKHAVLRTKGFLYHTGKNMREVVSSAGPRINRYFDRQWRINEEKISKMVFIGLDNMDIQSIQRAILTHYPIKLGA